MWNLVGRFWIISICQVLLVLPGVLGGGAAVWAGPSVSVESLPEGYSLERQWQFHPGDDAAWASPAYDSSDWASMAVPGRWPAGGFPHTNQFAWYRLSLNFDLEDPTLNRELSQLAVRLGKILSAYELYAGGQLVGGVGKLPPRGEVDFDRQRVYPIPTSAIAADGTLVLALRVWGGDAAAMDFWRAGPYRGEFSLGDQGRLLLSGVYSELPGLLFCVLFISFGFYHLYLYYRNRQLGTYFWYGLAAINIGIYSLMLIQWKYLLDWPFLLLKKIEIGAICLFPALGIQMLWSLLRQPVGRGLRLYQLSFVVFFLVVLLVPGHDIYYHMLPIWQLWAVPVLILVSWLIIHEALAGNPEARTLIVGVLIFVATSVNDLLIDLASWHTVRLVPYGFVAIMLAMSVSLANRFTGMLTGLEKEVAQRTTALSQANEQLAAAARVDPLTSLLNRRGFAEESEDEIRRMSRTGRTFSLVLADVDNFKNFNDRHGHACGDHVLQQAAAIFRANLREVDQVARWGGEEFIVLLPETNLGGAALLAEKLRKSIADTVFEFEGQRLGITMTFGVAGFNQGEHIDASIARADAALYNGKELGRNQVMVSGGRNINPAS